MKNSIFLLTILFAGSFAYADSGNSETVIAQPQLFIVAPVRPTANSCTHIPNRKCDFVCCSDKGEPPVCGCYL